MNKRMNNTFVHFSFSYFSSRVAAARGGRGRDCRSRSSLTGCAIAASMLPFLSQTLRAIRVFDVSFPRTGRGYWFCAFFDPDLLEFDEDLWWGWWWWFFVSRSRGEEGGGDERVSQSGVCGN